MDALSGFNVTKLWDVDPALLPNSPDFLQNPSLPRRRPVGPHFLDTEGCLCNRRLAPGTTAAGNDYLWRCVGDQTAGAAKDTGGKWFRPTVAGNSVIVQINITQLPINDGSNPPDRSKSLQWEPDSSSLVPGLNLLSVWDQACTGENHTTFSTSLYRAASQIEQGHPPLDAAPCWRVGSIPLQIQNVSDWQTNGCRPGFLCANNTVNSLPQYCPPFNECQGARLGSLQCVVNDTIINMGPFEPIICQSGFYCPPGGKVKLLCPKGSYCQQGAVTPTPCGVGSYCPEGSKYQRFLIPIGIMAAIDVFLIIGVLIFRFRKIMTARAQGGRGGSWSSPKTAVDEITKVLTRQRTKRPSAEGDRLAETDLEAAGKKSTEDPATTDVWAGFQQALDVPARVYHGDNGLMTPIRHSLENSLSPEIRAFVESMRKATDVTDFGLSFGYSELTCQPNGSEDPILRNISGSIRNGTLTAIMGGSGAGKSTFVNVLMGKVECTHGNITINGVPDRLQRYKKLVGYVPQDDIVLPDMTVSENILHSARIRLPRAWGEADIQAHVDSVISCLELSHVRDSMVGSVGKPTISGGQRKRVSIGMELAAAPMAIFLDEPTSGLDATAASSIMRTLKAIARLGISVVVIIHQPRVEIFDMIDDLILLANGQQLYEGPESNVRPFFEKLGYSFPKHANFGDVVTDIITGNGRPYKGAGDISKDGLVAHWRASRSEPTSSNGCPDPSLPDPEVSASGTTTAIPSRAATPTQPALDAIISNTEKSASCSESSGPSATVGTGGDNGNNNPNANAATTEKPEPRPVRPRRRSRSRFRDSTLSITSVRDSVRDSVPVFFPRPMNPQRALMLQHLKKRGAPWLTQARLCLFRALLQQYRDVSTLFFELGLAALAGFLLGLAENPKNGVLFLAPYYPPYDILSVSMDVKSAPEMALLTAIAIGLVSSAPGVRFFSEEMLVHRREAEAGHSRLAYFVAKSASVLPRMTLACLHFSAPLMLLSVPVIPFGVAFVTNLFYFYCIYGLASCVSMVAKRDSAPLLATMISLIVGILSGAAPSLNSVKTWHLEWLWRASPGVWLAEIYFGQLVNPFRDIYDVHMAARLTGFDLEGLGRNLGVLIAIGTIYRIIAFVGLVAGKNFRL